jgi:hypothetical protein
MQEYNTIQRQLDDLTGTVSEQRHAEQRHAERRFVEAMMRTNDSPTAIEPLEHGYSTENRAQRRERERRERRAAKKVPA